MSQSLIGADYQYSLCQLLGYIATRTLPLVVESRLGLVVFRDAPVEAKSVPIPL